MPATRRSDRSEVLSLSTEERLAAVEAEVATLLAAHDERLKADAESLQHSLHFIEGCKRILGQDRSD